MTKLTKKQAMEIGGPDLIEKLETFNRPFVQDKNCKRKSTSEGDHAMLSPSSASRWMACTPSAVLEQNFENKNSAFAMEGTTAHALCEILLREINGFITKAEFDTQFKVIQLSEFYSPSMLEYCENYADFVNQQCIGEHHLFLEQKLSMSDWIPSSHGTADSLVILPAEKKIIFTDLKYGKGIRVEAKQNSQLKIYALGALQTMAFIFGDIFETIETTIYQPRIDNISSYSYTVQELLDWAENELKPKAELAFEGKGEFKAGTHCGFCNAKAQCRALAEYNMELAKMDFANPDLLTDEETLQIYNQKALFESWMDAVSTHVLTEALNGKAWPGLKLVAGRSVRAYSDQTKVAEALKAKDFTDVFKAPALLGLGELEKKIGKAPFNEIVGPLLVKTEPKPTLAAESDKRPVWAKSAENDFAVEI